MRVHHLDAISGCPLGGWLMDGRAPSLLRRGELCCHCLLIETAAGLVLVDTGYGLRDVRNPKERLSSFFLALMSPDFREDMTAVRQVERLGYRADDVRHIVLTHLDFDHAGGLDDFPRARVHLLQRERDDAIAQRSWLDRQRFRPQQWSSRPRWRVYRADDGGEAWHGFACVRQLEGLPPELLLVPLRGHTLGHAGVAVGGAAGWLLQAGDAYFDRREMDIDRPRCRPGLALYQTMMEKDRRARLDNQRRLRELKRVAGTEVTVLSAHDPYEFEQAAGHAMRLPISAHVRPARA